MMKGMDADLRTLGGGARACIVTLGFVRRSG